MLKRLAAFLGFLCLVLLLLAFDEGQVERGANAVRARVEPTIDRIRDAPISLPRLPKLRPTSPRAATPEGLAVVGAFAAPEGQAGGDLTMDGAVLTFETAPKLRTRPYRIALGREAAARGLNAAPDQQVELREIVPLDARTPIVGSPLCEGGLPGWLALVRDGRGLSLQLWRAGPAPDGEGAAVCGRLTFEGGRP